MSYFCDDVDTALSGYHTSVYTGLGLPGADVPAGGTDGASVLYPCITLPADAAVEVFAQLTRLPTVGTLVFAEDGSFDYTGATDYLEFRLWVDGVASTTDIGYGAGIARVNLSVGSAVNLAPDAQQIAIAGGVPTVAQPITIAPAAQQIAIAGGVPSISQPQSLSPAAQQIAVAGGVPTVAQSIVLAPAAQQIIVVGGVPSITQPQSLSPGVQQIVVVGGVPSIGQSEAFAPDAQQIIVVGGVPTIGQPQSLSPGAQQITVYGWAPLLSQVEGPPPVADPIRLLAIISQEIAFEATIEQA